MLCMLLAACRRELPPPSAGPDAASPAACGYPLVVRDDRGVDVTLRAEPRRIVSLLPSHTETLLALGAGSRVVGVDDFSAGIPEVAGLPSLGGLYDARLEVLLSTRPDLVLMSESNGAAAPVERGGLVVWGGSAHRFDDVFRVIEAIGRLICKQPEAAHLARQVADDVADVEGHVRGRPVVRVYYELDPTPYTVGPFSVIGAMIAKAGGEDVVGDGLGDFPKISPEAVIAGNPDVVLGVSLEEVRKRPGWERIAAVRSGRVYKLTPREAELVSRPGPHLADGLRALVRILHPEVSL